jgi:hypothetical protein
MVKECKNTPSFGIVSLTKTLPYRRGVSIMIAQNDQKKQLPNELNSGFKELKILQHLRNAGISKNFGFTCSYLFQIVLCLIFHHKNWFSLLESKKSDEFPAKDAVYRFLNNPSFAWRRFLLSLSSSTYQKVNKLTSTKRPSVFVIDDSAFERNRSKKVELLARCKDHSSTKNRYYKGFRMLTFGWSDGHTFLPIDFSLLSSTTSVINGITAKIDKRTSGYKRRIEALQKAPDQIPAMLDRALDAGITASYVLMDTWFTHAPLVQAIVERGLDVIGMVKRGNQRYIVQGRRVSLEELYYSATSVQGKKGILRSIHTELSTSTGTLPVKVVFVRHRNKKREWLAILSTDCSLTDQEIIQTYGLRWDIEVFFKCTKSLLRLQKEFQGRSYDLLISHTTIVFARYILLAWQHRCSTDNRTLGGLFYELCDEVSELDWAVALQQLIELLGDVMKKSNRKITKLIKSQLQQWIADLPNYIKAYMPDLCCES